MAEKLTKPQRRALTILRDKPELGGRMRWFAKAMWPDSPAWEKHSNCGASGGATKGISMPMNAGAYLTKLMEKGLVHRTYPYSNNERATFVISEKGREALEERGW